MFDKFYRGPHGGASGAGLGLPICRGIAQAHGGTVRAENCSAGGALFRVMLPRVGDPPAVPVEAEITGVGP